MKITDDGIIAPEHGSEWDDETRFGGVSAEVEKPKKPKHNLDSEANKKRLKLLQEWFDQEWTRQAHNRAQMAIDEDYYDSLQYTEEEIEELLDRGQPPIVQNEIKPTIDWMIGTERRTRIDYKVLPRRKEEGDLAEVKTKLLKYLSDVNRTPYARSKAFNSAAKAGVGWLEIGIRGDDTDEPLYHRAESWRRILYDSNSEESDLSDARYLFRWKYLDKDVACAYFPHRKSIINKAVLEGNLSSVSDSDDDDLWYMGARVTEYGNDFSGSTGKYRPYNGSAFTTSRRERVKLVEAWYRMPKVEKKFRDGPYAGEVYEKDNDDHIDAASEYSLYDKIVMEMRCAIFTEAGLLYEGPSPYEHDRFPFVPIWAYRRSRDNAPYSPSRPMRDSQDSLNKRGSKALWILSSNQVVMEPGAVEDVEELRDEVSRPDAIIVKKRGAEFEITRDLQLAREHTMLMDRDMVYIRNAGGVTSENLGRETNADSGRAIIARQEQGGVLTTEIFDNLRYAVQVAGEIELSLIEQFYGQEKVVRLVGERGNTTFVEINRLDPATGEILNDITATKSDFVVSQQDYKDSLRIAMFESLFDITGRLAQMSPDIALRLLDLVVEMADIPNRDELVARIRQINGMRDPESDPTPEELQAEQEAKQLQDIQKQMMIERAKAELEEILAKKEKLSAEAINTRLEAMYTALQSGQLVSTTPTAAAAADDIMRGAGFTDQTPKADAEAAKMAGELQGIADAARVQQAQAQEPPGVQMPTPEQAAPVSPQIGARQGIETPENDGTR